MFHERLAAKRREKGLSQAELARRVGVGRDSYNKYERTGASPSHATLVLLARELDTTVDYLLTGEDGENGKAAHRKVDDEDIKFALFGGDGNITDEQFEEVKRYARYLREREAGDK